MFWVKTFGESGTFWVKTFGESGIFWVKTFWESGIFVYLTFPDFPLQIGLIVYHFRYNVGYQTYLVLLAKYLLHHAKSFSAFSVTFAAEMRIISRSTNEQLLSINLKLKAYEKDFYFDCCCLDGS